MTPWDAALDQLDAEGHPHARRYRELCTDDADPDRRDAYRDLVVRLEGGRPPARPIVPVSLGDPPPARRGCCG